MGLSISKNISTVIERCIKVIFISLIVAQFMGCGKSSFLDKKPNESFILAKSLNDFQQIIDNAEMMNTGVNPSFGEAASDDYYAENLIESPPYGKSLRSLYCWLDKDLYTLKQLEWDFPYRTILYANLVLEGVNKITPQAIEVERYKNVKGSAIFFRAEKYFQLAQVFSPHLNEQNQNEFLGIPRRNGTDMTEEISRPTIKKTYEDIISDLVLSSDLLPNLPLGGYKTRPSKCAAFALLSRVYLILGKYDSSLYYSDKALELYEVLMDYNGGAGIDPFAYNPFQQFNPEVIFHSTLIQNPLTVSPLLSPGTLMVDTNLVASYKEGDLRKLRYFQFDGLGFSFIGSYDGSGLLWGGIATDEIYLIKAECLARLNRTDLAMATLNKLMQKRWKEDEWMELHANDSLEALKMILTERRKELLFRGLRWPDLRRLNKDGANIILRRNFEGNIYELLPNDKKYTFLIPPDVIGFNPEMQQNPR